MMEHCCRDLLPFSHKNISEVGHWCWAIRPRSYYNSLQRCLMRLRSGLCAGQSNSSTPISTNHFCMDLAWCAGNCHVETGKGLLQTVATKMEAHNCLECQCMMWWCPHTFVYELFRASLVISNHTMISEYCFNYRSYLIEKRWCW